MQQSKNAAQIQIKCFHLDHEQPNEFARSKIGREQAKNALKEV